MRQSLQGVVELVAVVLADGSVGPIAVTKSLDLDLDQSAVAAVRRWTFRLGRKDNQPVAVLATVEMKFTLR
jgi:TonB family protein